MSSTSSFYASKALSLRTSSSSHSGRNSPSNLASFINSRRSRPPLLQSRDTASSPRDPGSSEEPDEGGGVGVRYEQQQQYDDDELLGKQEDNNEDYDEEDSISVRSRASTPRQRSREVHFSPGRSNGSPVKPQNALRIPDFQQIFDNEEYDVFDDDETPSFSDTTVTIPNKVLDNMKLPLPAPGQAIMDSPAPWGRHVREKSEDSEIMEIKPEVYHAKSDSAGRSGLEKVTNTEFRLEVAGWQEGDEEQERRGETEIFNGYESKARGGVGYDEEGSVPQQIEDGEYYHTDYDDDNDYSDYDDQKDEPGIWSEGSPTISSRGWSGKDAFENLRLPKPEGPVSHPNDKGKGKAQNQDYSSEVQKLDYRTQRKKLRPLSARSNIPWSEATGEDPQLGLRMTELTAGRGHTPHNKEVTVVPERKNNERPRRLVSGTNNIDTTSLLPESELSTLPTYSSLLAALATLRSKRHTTIPPSQLPSELEELAKSYYPHDPRKPEKFFNKLDDKQHALAGEYIINKKRELEGKLAGVAAKRRRVVEDMKREVEKAAEVRVAKLKRTEERREVLRGGIGKVLREGGLWL